MGRRVGRRVGRVGLIVGFGLGLGFALALALPSGVLAHGDEPVPPLDATSFLLGWSFDPTVWLPALAALLLWGIGVGRANRAHPASRVSRWRTSSWIAGVAVIVFALDGGIGRYDTTLFADHMVQHLLLTLVGPPLLLLAGPITLALQASSGETRRRWLLPLLRSRAVRWLSNPVVAGVIFTVTLWGSHFSPLYELALERPAVHIAEHALYLSTALLFWWPAIGRNLSPWRLGPAGAALYVGLQLPVMSFLAVAILMAPAPLYAWYAEAARTWGPTPLADQQLAGGIMWIAGSIAMTAAFLGLIALWMRDEERRGARDDRRLDAALALDSAGEAGDQPSGGTGAARYSR